MPKIAAKPVLFKAPVSIGTDEYTAHLSQCQHVPTQPTASLSEVEVNGCTLECWLHGSGFDIRTGEPSGPPAIVPINVYPVKIDGDDVYVATTPQSLER